MAGHSIQRVFNLIINHENNINNKSYNVPYYGASLKSVICNMLFVYKNRNKLGVNHVTGDIHYVILALIGCKTILTIHDLVLLHNIKNPVKRKILFILWYYLPIRLANKVTCISENTKMEIIKYVKRKDIIVIDNPIDNNYSIVHKKFNENSVRILQVGTGSNKNLERVIESLFNVKCHFRIIGKLSEDHLKLLKHHKIYYSNECNISDEQMINEYHEADIISFPSLFEGFGMPIIEGQSIGRIVLTSNLSPMKDIGNDAAIFVDPYSVQSIRNGFIEIINLDTCSRIKLIEKGIQNVKKYQRHNIVNKYVELYKSLI